MSVEQAVSLLAWPKVLGQHPSEGGDVEVHLGKFSPHVKHAGVNAPLPKVCHHARGCADVVWVKHACLRIELKLTPTTLRSD